MVAVKVLKLEGYAASTNLHGNEMDKLALLSFKSLITEDPLGALNSWNDSSHYCYWAGVHCDSKSLRVTALKLSGRELSGTLSSQVGNLSFLRILDLSENLFNGEIPLGLGNLKRLRTLNVSYNSLGEYGMGAPVSILGDVYSFGIILLEIMTEKRPTDSLLQEKDMKLQEFVEHALREQDIEVFDNSSLCEEVTGEAQTWSEGWDCLTNDQIQCLTRILEIGVTCSSELPKNRMSMSQVHQELLVIRDTFRPKRSNIRRASCVCS